MKKFISILLFFAVFAFFGCEDLVNDVKGVIDENAEEAYLGDTNVSNNKSTSEGTNELQGKTISDGTTKMKFANSYVTKSDDTPETANARSVDHVAGKMDFTYSYNSNDKTLDFQLNQVWGSGFTTAQTYEKQIKKATETYQSITDKVVNSLSKDDLYKSFLTLGESVKGIVVDKAKSYVEKQENILSDYLEKKYNAVIKFGYAFDSEEAPAAITLTEKFQGNLTDASSKFVYTSTSDGITIVLNDYDHVTPFKIEIESEDDEGNITTEIYVGVPSIEEDTITVSLLPYSGDVLTDTGAAIKIPTKISEPIISNLTEAAVSGKAVDIITELQTNNDSATLKALIDESIGSQELKATYNVEDATTDSPAKLVLSFTQVPDYLSNLQNASITLTHTPLLGATYNIVQ